MMLQSKKVIISGVAYTILAEGTYVTVAEPEKPYKKYKLTDKKVLVVSEKEDFAYFGEDLGDLGIKPGDKGISYNGKQFVLNTNDNQILKSVKFGEPEGNMKFWDYEDSNDKDILISIGLDEGTGKRIDVVGSVISKNEIKFKE